MNRSALCIKMLRILNSQELVSRKELAEKLDTNIRNVAEFKKELETAGFLIETVQGRAGGYHLVQQALTPVVGLEPNEYQAIDEASSFLQAHSDFLPIQDYLEAVSKIKAASSYQINSSSILFRNPSIILSDAMREMIALCENARDSSRCLQLEYKSMHSLDYKKIVIQPYEILSVKGAYYVLGYNVGIKEFRFYKFSDARLKTCVKLKKQFLRDLAFDVRDYVGKVGLMKNDLHDLDCIIEGELALLIYESEIGIQSQKEWIDENHLHLKTIIEGKIEATRFVLSLGSSCRIDDSCDFKEVILDNIRKMAELYG